MRDRNIAYLNGSDVAGFLNVLDLHRGSLSFAGLHERVGSFVPAAEQERPLPVLGHLFGYGFFQSHCGGIGTDTAALKIQYENAGRVDFE
ncbi:hypothetical protein D3C75_250920 [compost metagenome]